MKVKYKERVIQQILHRGKTIGDIWGINLQKLNYSDQREIERYISSIEGLKEHGYTSIYFEELLPPNIKSLIADKLSMDLEQGRDIRLYNIPYITKALKSKWKDDIIKKEILIISSKKEEVLEVIYSVYDDFSFISVMGLSSEDGEEVYEKVLDDFGISIYYPKGENVTFKRYGIMINLENYAFVNLNDIRSNTIVIDFSEGKPLSKVNRFVIEDISFDISDYGLDVNSWIGNEVSSDLFSSLFKGERELYCRIYKNHELFKMADFLNQNLKIKGGF